MIRFCLCMIWLAGFLKPVEGQRLLTRDAKVSFYSKAKVEDIEAHNPKGACMLDAKTGKIECTVLMKGFMFKKALMQEHFNENYVESHKFPKAQFKGSIKNPELDLNKDGKYQWHVEGTMELHGVTMPISTTAAAEIKSGVLSVQCKFPITLKDYNILIPAVVRDNIAPMVDVTINIESFKGHL